MKQSSGPYVIGLTGGIACGKTHIADELRRAGMPVLDADEISHSLTGPGGEALGAIAQAFGPEVIDQEAGLNRKKMAELVFADSAARERLEGILHPMITRRLREDTAAYGDRIVVWDVPLLFETGLDRFCSETWCAVIPRALQLFRLMRRNSLDQKAAEARIDSQMPLAEKAQRARHIVCTHGSYARTRERVRGLLRNSKRRSGYE